MNKTFLAVGALFLVLVIGLLLFSGRRPSVSDLQSESKSNQSSNSAQGRRKDSLRNLLSSGKNLSCDVSVTAPEGGTMSGKVFVSGQRMRGDFTAKIEGREIQSYTISNGGYSYSWSSLTPQGVKVRIDQTAASGSRNESADLDREMDVDCREWLVDSSKFEIPANVQFVETGFSQSDGPTPPVSSSPSGSAQPGSSSVCDSMTDAEAKAACKAALGN